MYFVFLDEVFDDTRDFIQAHFRFSPRTDTPFWQANKEISLAPNIAEKIDMYRAGLPVCMPASDDADAYYHNFEMEFRNFWTNSNYYCVFAGLDFLPDHPIPALAHRPESVHRAEPVFAEIKREQRQLFDALPTCHEFLQRLHGRQAPARHT